MVRFYKLFIDKLTFCYDCFDRIVINGYIMYFQQSTNLCFYFKVILGHKFVNKKLLFSVTKKYNKKIEDLSHQLGLSNEYIDPKERKDEFVKRYREVYERKNKFGVYYILKTRENESTFRVARPNLKDCDSDNYLSKARKIYTQYYFYIHDEILGNFSLRIASYLPFKVTAYLNGHSYIERYFKNKYGKKRIYKKRENAFINIEDINILFEAKENFSPELIKERLDYWVEQLGPELEKQPLNYSYFID